METQPTQELTLISISPGNMAPETPLPGSRPSPGDACRIPCRRRDGTIAAWAIVDSDDFEWLSSFKWSLNAQGYAWRHVYFPETQKTLHQRMHRDILGLWFYDSRQGDHRNRDRLDNRRSNLRITTKAGNNQNVRPQERRSSRYRGVVWNKARRKWVARASVDGVNHYLGIYTDEKEAARVARDFRREHLLYATD